MVKILSADKQGQISKEFASVVSVFIWGGKIWKIKKKKTSEELYSKKGSDGN